MTVQEALDHDWKEGEKLWEVYYTFPRELTMQFEDFKEYLPVGVIDVTVKNVKWSEPKYKITFENVDIVFDADWGLGEQDNPYSNKILAAMITHRQSLPDYYTNSEFCIDKFFNKEDAEKRYKEVVKKWNKKIKAFQKKQIAKLEEAKQEYEKLLAVGIIDVDKYTIK